MMIHSAAILLKVNFILSSISDFIIDVLAFLVKWLLHTFFREEELTERERKEKHSLEMKK